MPAPLEESNYWMATLPRDPAPPLQSDTRTDITIVGGGYTGLWTAIFLKQMEPSIGITLIEKNRIGYGGSGRNGGIVGETVDHSDALAVSHFGLEEAKLLARAGRENVMDMIAFLRANNVDCDFEPTGRLSVALTPAHLQEAQYALDVAGRLGISGMRILSRDEIQQELHCDLYLGGTFSYGGGILNPYKLALGLRTVATDLGIQIYENTSVTGIRKGMIDAGQATIRTRKTILATNAYSHHLFPKLLRYFLPLYDYIIVSEPLTAQQLEWIGWKNRQGVTDGRTFFNYYRLTKDNRILWGTSEAKYYRPNRVDPSCDHSQQHYDALLRSFQKHFPKLRDLTFPFRWGGPIASTTRLTPFFGSLHEGSTHYALGYTGHGIGSTRLAGNILAHMALERRSELLELQLVRRKPFPFPFEPFRSAAVAMVTRSLRRVDEGRKPGVMLRILNRLGIHFSS